MSYDYTTILSALPVAYFDHVKDNVPKNETTTWEDFKDFLEWSLDVVGAKRESAEGHFRHANIVVEEESN